MGYWESPICKECREPYERLSSSTWDNLKIVDICDYENGRIISPWEKILCT